MVELARAIAQHPAVYRVDLLTRLIQDPNVDPSYGEPEECIWKAPDEKGLGGAYIERLACGPPKKYLRCWTAFNTSNMQVCKQPCLASARPGVLFLVHRLLGFMMAEDIPPIPI